MKEVGTTVGTLVGLLLGAAVGTPVGRTVGAVLGANVGLSVGLTEGLAEGFVVGAKVGTAPRKLLNNKKSTKEYFIIACRDEMIIATEEDVSTDTKGCDYLSLKLQISKKASLVQHKL